MVGVLAKEHLRYVEARRANPFNSNSGALLDQVKHADGHAGAAARVGEIDRFREDVIGCDEPSAGTKQSFYNRTRSRVMCVLSVNQRIQS